MRKMHRRKPNAKWSREVSQRRDVIAQYLRLMRANFAHPRGTERDQLTAGTERRTNG